MIWVTHLPFRTQPLLVAEAQSAINSLLAAGHAQTGLQNREFVACQPSRASDVTAGPEVESGRAPGAAGREAFLAEVYVWVEKYGGSINGQLRRLGSSLDWTRSVRPTALCYHTCQLRTA